MNCETIRKGEECFFAGKNGCTFNGGTCKQIIEACEGCKNAIEVPDGKYCACFPNPEAKWRIKDVTWDKCPRATHVKGNKPEVKEIRVNPLKASKKSKKAKKK
jgi:hypothetical protein